MAYSQTGRPIRLDTSLGEDKLLLEEFDGWEGVSQQFAFHLRAVSPDDALPIEDLLNEAVVVSLRMIHDDPRYIHGVVNRTTHLERSHGLTSYELEVVPWTWFLSLINDCRIFLDKTVPQIVEEVFSDPGLPSCVSYRFDLSESYKPREYCVQYRESDLNFIARLLEEEGIFYYFEHTSEEHTLVLCDDSSKFPSCPGDASIPYSAGAAGAREEDVIHSFDRNFQVCSRTVTLTDFDFRNPAENLQVNRTSDRYEIYDYPGYYSSRDVGERYAGIRLEEQEVQRKTVQGTGNCRQFIPGHTFQVDDLTGGISQTTYALLWVQHSAAGTSYRSEGPRAFSYDNRFQAIPAATKYRPPRIAQKPTVRGTQTAIVVGPEGREIDVDNFGRVRVHFHWERKQHSSCPVRVSQVWAGKTWGAIQIPRIGQEVVVDFLEGDPDRPLIVGRVYNGEQMPPYALPGDQTISGVKSRSTEKGAAANYNELIFEDKKGAEYIRIHAEREMREFVEKDSYEFVGQDRHLIVLGSQAEQVTGDQHLSVGGELRQSVTGDLSQKIGGSHHAKVGSLYTVEGGQEIHIKGGAKVIIEAGMQLSFVGPGGFVDIGPAGVTIQGSMVLINSGGSHGTGTECQPKQPKSPKKAEET
jgi:type VI secretion system secreted protein VgrG